MCHNHAALAVDARSTCHGGWSATWSDAPICLFARLSEWGGRMWPRLWLAACVAVLCCVAAVEAQCPNNCTDHGQCVDNSCVCDTPFTDPDCGLWSTELQTNGTPLAVPCVPGVGMQLTVRSPVMRALPHHRPLTARAGCSGAADRAHITAHHRGPVRRHQQRVSAALHRRRVSAFPPPTAPPTHHRHIADVPHQLRRHPHGVHGVAQRHRRGPAVLDVAQPAARPHLCHRRVGRVPARCHRCALAGLCAVSHWQSHRFLLSVFCFPLARAAH